MAATKTKAIKHRQKTYSLSAPVAEKFERARHEYRLTTTQFMDVVLNHWMGLEPEEQVRLIRQSPDK